MQATVEASTLHGKYAETVDRDSAHERLAARLEAGAAAAAEEEPRSKPAKKIRYPKRPQQEQGSVVTDIMTSPVAKDLIRTAAREIVRGIFGTARRR